MAVNKIFIVIGAAAAAGVLWVLTSPQVLVPAPGSTSAAPPPKTDAGGAALQAELAQCTAFMDWKKDPDWDKTLEHCEAVLQLDPVNSEARKARRVATFEKNNLQLYETALRHVDAGEDAEALATFTLMDSESLYFRPARRPFQQTRDAIALKAKQACLALHQQKQDDLAWPRCREAHFTRYVPPCSGIHDDEDLAPVYALLLRDHPNEAPWKDPDTYWRFLSPGLVNCSIDTQRIDAIRKKYADPDLAAAVTNFASDYIKGQAAIARYLGKGGKDTRSARKLQALMNTAFDEHQKGYEFILKNRLAGAGKHYQAALDVDAQLMPKDWPSNQAKAMRYELSDKYADISKIDFEHNRLEKSYVACVAGYAFSTSNPSILECLSTLENKAVQLAANDTCSDLKQVLAISRPESLVYKNATRKRLDQKCK